jgi:arabinogalactan endo-1,4-beta-galactosidase
MNPDFIQIGNEINTGMLFPTGNITTNSTQFKELLQSGIQSVRDNSTTAKIIIHFAGIQNSDWFFSQITNLDYDIIGLSYYPVWHGKSVSLLQSTLDNLSKKYNKEIVIAETAYPFTLDYNDWTNNIIGLENQLILPDYPASPEGQQNFLAKMKTITSEIEKGIGFCYWGAELIAFEGPESPNGSPWENQALFDFNNKALPVIDVFKEE